MRTKSKALNLSVKMALAIVMICNGFFLAGCYEKSEIDEEGQKPAAVYHIAGVVTDYNYGGALKGVAVKIEGDYAAVSTGANGEFSIRLGAITPAAEGYAVTYSLDGYDTATKQVYISAVSDGLSSITTASVALRVTGTSTESPAAPPVEGADPSVSQAEMEAAVTEMNDLLAATLTEEVEEELKNEVIAVMGSGTTGEITIGETAVTIKENGVVEAATPIIFEKSVATTTMTYAYTITSGFEILGDIESVAKPATRAIGDVINDPTTIANFKKSVASELNMPEGFTTTTATVNYLVPTGYRVTGYKIVKQLAAKRHTYMINGEYLSGKASTQTSTVVEPTYESHNGDSHDAHGSNPNAGGGSSI